MKLLNVHLLKPGMILGRDVYATKNKTIPFITKGSMLTSHNIRALKAGNYGSVYITGENDPRLGAVDEKKNRTKESKPAVAPTLKNRAIDNLQDLFKMVAVGGESTGVTAPQLVRQLDTVVDQLVDSLVRDPGALINIADLKSYDEYTYHHSLSVAVLAIATGQALGFAVNDLRHLGKCALMHDIGKTAMPIELINKPSRLTYEEFAVLKTHPEAGYNYLAEQGIGDERLRQGVLYHHERMDGEGYPKGLRANRIPMWSRIISVADVYDALTSYRPYREPMSPADGVEYIMAGAGTAFDYEVVKAFLTKLELYPVGSRVALSTGAEARVLENEHTMRPVVQLLETGEVLDLFGDLSCLSITIIRLLSGRDLPTEASVAASVSGV